MTGLAALVAEELEVDPSRLSVELAPADEAFKNPALGFQLTGGSTSVKTSYQPLREAGAVARQMLVMAAAKRWGVPAAECSPKNGEVLHAKSGRRASYGELADDAARLPVPPPRPKSPKDFSVIGKPVPRLDARAKVDGSAIFGLDVQRPDMRIAAVARCPYFGGSLEWYDDAKARAVKGVEAVVKMPNGVAVVANSTWAAKQALSLLEIKWNEGPNARLSSASLRAKYAELLEKKGKPVRRTGDVELGRKQARQVLNAEYEAPYLAHAPMEPPNCTAHVTKDKCEIWAPTQGPGMARELASRITGLPQSKVVVHQTLLGGGFGRRFQQDYVAEAVFLSHQLKKPVKVVWSREDDLQHGYYRPYSLHRLSAGLDGKGNVTFWEHRIACQSIIAQVGSDFMANLMPFCLPSGMKRITGESAAKLFRGLLTDETSVEGASTFAYELPNVRVEWAHHEPGVPVGFWRSVGHSQNAFVVESFIDELAAAAGADPFEFRRKLLRKQHRNRWVLELAAEKAGWGKPLPAGLFRGIAQHHSFDSYAAAVAEISVEGGEIRVRRVVCAIDCGRVINPDLVSAQLESSVVFGLSAALKQQITLDGGRVQQANFHDYPALRMYESPEVETYFVKNEAAPTGVGEPGVPVVAPAVANAVFAATGKRLRRLPLSLGDG